MRIDYRWGAGDGNSYRKLAAELAVASPDAVLAVGGLVVGALQQTSRTLPIVFVNVPDPVGAGFVDSLARPGSNTTGFTVFEYGLSGKFLELLKQIAPRLARVAVIRDPSNVAGVGQWGAIQSVAPSFGVELRPVDVRDATEIERGITVFAREPNGGLIVTGEWIAQIHRD